MPGLAITVQLLRSLQRQRKFVIRSQMRQTNATLAEVRSRLGWSPDNPEAENKRIAERARRIVATIEKREAVAEERAKRAEMVAAGLKPNTREPVDPKPLPERDEAVARDVGFMVAATYRARRPLDALREQTEDEMGALAKSLPVWKWVEGVRGVGPVGLAKVVGEAGDLSAYANPAKLWTRMCVGMVLDESESMWRRQGDPGPRATKQDWVDHQYSRRRRSESWNVCQALLQSQWRGEKADTDTGEVVPAHALGPYGAAYAARKAYQRERNEAGLYAAAAAKAVAEFRRAGKAPPKESLDGRLTPKHLDNMARRYVEKRFYKHLWQAWNRQPVGWDDPGPDGNAVGTGAVA